MTLDAAELGTPSWVHCKTINTIHVSLLEDRLGALKPAAVSRVDEALRLSLGLG